MKKFNTFVNENDNTDELDPYQEEKWEEENDDSKLKIIEEIKDIVTKYGSYITMMELEADSSPIYKEEDDTIHLIERLTSNDVGIIVYGGYKGEEEIEEYDVNYEELEMDTLDEIKDLLDEAIENDLLEEDI